jgi:hypothetical protein
MFCRQTFADDISVKRGDLLTIFSDFLWSVLTVITALKYDTFVHGPRISDILKINFDACKISSKVGISVKMNV